jgi:hypothetical protein
MGGTIASLSLAPASAERYLAAWGPRPDIKLRILCERLLTDPVWASPTDYGFHCYDDRYRGDQLQLPAPQP